MDHVVVPLDASHVGAARRLGEELSAGWAGPIAQPPAPPHITLVSYSDLPPTQARRALEPVVAATVPFPVRAHGYGIFTGHQPVT